MMLQKGFYVFERGGGIILLVWLLGTPFLNNGCQQDSAYRQSMVDLLAEDTLYLSLHSPFGWVLDVFPEGSGKLCFQPNPVESITFPQKTFDYRGLKKRLNKSARTGLKPKKFVICINFMTTLRNHKR